MAFRLRCALFTIIPAFALTACGSGVPGLINSDVKTAQELIAKKEDGKAQEALSMALIKNPKDSRALFYAGVIEEHQKHWDAALTKLDAAIDADPSYAEAYSERALVKSRLNHESEALADVNQSIMLEPNVAKNHLRRALIALGEKDWDMALKSLEQVKTLEGESGKDAYWIAAYTGEAYIGLKDYQRGLKYLDNAVKLGGKLQPTVYLRRATIRARTGDFAGAKVDAAEFAAQRPDDASVHALLGALLCAKGDVETGAKEYSKALGKMPAGDIADMVDLGADNTASVTTLVDLMLAKHDFETAGAVLTKVEGHRPLESGEQYRAAVVALNSNQPERALSLLNSCISMAPEFIPARVEMIRYYAGKGMTTKAMELQREAFTVAKSAHDRSEVAGAMLRRSRR